MKRLAIALILAAALPGIAAPGTANSSQSKNPPSTPSDGERAFRANCSRCHKAPEQLSPSSVPAVIRHMRVRAMLPEKDAQAILHYLAP